LAKTIITEKTVLVGTTVLVELGESQPCISKLFDTTLHSIFPYHEFYLNFQLLHKNYLILKIITNYQTSPVKVNTENNLDSENYPQ
jgi:hypothetical protein